MGRPTRLPRSPTNFLLPWRPLSCAVGGRRARLTDGGARNSGHRECAYFRLDRIGDLLCPSGIQVAVAREHR